MNYKQGVLVRFFILALSSIVIAACSTYSDNIVDTTQQNLNAPIGQPAGDVFLVKQQNYKSQPGIAGATIYSSDRQIFDTIGDSAMNIFFAAGVGKYIDNQDRILIKSALLNTPIDQETHWTNKKTRNAFKINTVNKQGVGDNFCQLMQLAITTKDGVTQAPYFVDICRAPSGILYVKQNNPVNVSLDNNINILYN